MKFVYLVSALQPVYFDVALTALKGSFHTKDQQFGFEAIPFGEDITFMHLRYSFRYSALGYFFMKIFGGTKIGFSIIGTDRVCATALQRWHTLIRLTFLMINDSRDESVNGMI